MNDSARTQSVLFKGLAPKPVTVRFEDERTSSDGGAILLKAADRRMGMISSIAESLTDRRDGSRVKHEVEELLPQRIFGITCGYEDGNDAARMAADPVLKTLAGRDPFGEDLASQPSISRFERSATRRDLFRMGPSLMKALLADLVAAGARILECACGPCIGMGQVPPINGVCVRTSNRNFKGRSGTNDAFVYLASPETAAATAMAAILSNRMQTSPAVLIISGGNIDQSVFEQIPARDRTPATEN